MWSWSAQYKRTGLTKCIELREQWNPTVVLIINKYTMTLHPMSFSSLPNPPHPTSHTCTHTCTHVRMHAHIAQPYKHTCTQVSHINDLFSVSRVKKHACTKINVNFNFMNDWNKEFLHLKSSSSKPVVYSRCDLPEFCSYNYWNSSTVFRNMPGIYECYRQLTKVRLVFKQEM